MRAIENLGVLHIGRTAAAACNCYVLNAVKYSKIAHVVPERISIAVVPECVILATVPERISIAVVPERISIAVVPECIVVAIVPERIT